jgi:hypothetical protein
MSMMTSSAFSAAERRATAASVNGRVLKCCRHVRGNLDLRHAF